VERAEWDRRYATAELVWTASPNRFVVEETAGMRPGRALDLAAGEGRNAVWLAERGWRVTAVDFSSVALGKAERLAASRGVSVTPVTADLREYRPGEGAYDLVLIAYVHLPAAEFALVLRRAVSAVAPSGALVVIGHDRTNLTDGVGGPSDPGVLYTPESVTAALDGMVVRRSERARRPVTIETGERDAIDTVVHAVRA
jgi:2-polyprenyl-3-methyl-5-hydroxy-6-metoxy-1,4-benzoquinol methylase